MTYTTVAQYAAVHHVTPRRVRAWIESKRIPADKIGRDWMIPEGSPRPEDLRIVENPVRNRRK